MAKIINLFNHKGGVSKTTTVLPSNGRLTTIVLFLVADRRGGFLLILRNCRS